MAERYNPLSRDGATYCDPRLATLVTGDQLRYALTHGWEIADIRQNARFHGSRRLSAYVFRLSHAGETTTITTVRNPYITRLVAWHRAHQRMVAAAIDDEESAPLVAQV